jgi:5S rRNA maturation endonuclease (ribonuclease M5)
MQPRRPRSRLDGQTATSLPDRQGTPALTHNRPIGRSLKPQSSKETPLRPALFGLAFLLIANGGASAADAVFPPGSRIGLVPPPGLTVSRSFPGFGDAENKVVMLFSELPGGAYEDFIKGMTTTAKSASGVSGFGQEVLLTQHGAGTLIVADQDANGEKLRKWLLVTRNTVTDRSADISRAYVVTVQVPEAAQALYPEEAIRKSLATLALREEIPNAEILSMLPFEVTDIAGFRHARILAPARSIVLTDEDKTGADPAKNSYFFITIAPSGPIQPDDRERAARQLLRNITGYSDTRVISAEPQRIGGSPGFEIRLEGKEARSGAEVALVQWVRFAGGSFLHMVGIAPKAEWPAAFSRFRAVRDGIEAR